MKKRPLENKRQVFALAFCSLHVRVYGKEAFFFIRIAENLVVNHISFSAFFIHQFNRI